MLQQPQTTQVPSCLIKAACATALLLYQSLHDVEQLGHQGSSCAQAGITGPEQSHTAGSPAAVDGRHAQGTDSKAEARPYLVCCRAAPCTVGPALLPLLLAGPPRAARLPGTLAGPAGTIARAWPGEGGRCAQSPIQRGLRWVEARERGDSGGGSGGQVPAGQSLAAFSLKPSG